MKMLLIVPCLLLSACAGLGASHMSPEQLKAAASDKNANVVCVQGVGPWGKANTVYMNVDRAVIQSGGIKVDSECGVTFNNTLPILPPKP